MKLQTVARTGAWFFLLGFVSFAADYCPPRSAPKKPSAAAAVAPKENLGTLVNYPANRAFLAQCGKAGVTAAKVTSTEPTGLAAKVKTLVSARCTSCHSPGSNKGTPKFADALDIPDLVAKGFLKPGDPDASIFFKVVQSDEMPQSGNSLSDDEKTLLARWIQEGAAPLKSTAVFPDVGFISEADKEECLLNDLSAQPERDRPFLRYLTLTHLFNAKRTEEIARVHLALARLVNALSWSENIRRPSVVDGLGSILRIDLRDYQWTDATWARVLAQNPYGVKLNNKKSQALYGSFVGQQIPHVRGDWFVFAASRPPLYHDILDLPGGDGKPGADLALEKLLGVDFRRGFERGEVIRAGTRQSGVSFHNRVIERHNSKYGTYWKSYDFETDDGEQNIFDHPLDFKQNGGEIIFSLPNSMHAYLLIDAQGKRINDGPLTIVHHDKRPEDNSKVLNGLSCFECHQQGMRRVVDQIRNHAESEAFSEGERERIFQVYGTRERLEGLFKKDEDQFAAAHEKAGVPVKDIEEPIFATSQKFERALSEQSAAAELGLALPDFQSLLRRDQKLLRKLALGAAFTIDRPSFNKEFGNIIQVVQQGNFIRPTISTTPETSPTPTKLEPKISLARRSAPVEGSDPDLTFVPILGGTFTIGSPNNEFERRDDEKLRSVTVRAFGMQTIEVTQGLWKRYLPLPRQAQAGDRLPVTNVSWSEVASFLVKLNADPALSSERYRLPTEEEWEVATRAGTETAFSFGASAATLSEFDWFGENSSTVQTVATRKPNPAGIFDLHGNVSEWTSTRHSSDAEGDHYVVKGGNYLGGAARCRSASRGELAAKARHPFIGFRLVKEGN